ncbi:hypothetical protein K469DRAFT_747402 [Zopfia rhizophila CBS 207.26]|uniref:Uncharacterized protein n=1 Tax=Zopfia rhizophila CBS 207.26 TaxID=1314779 RepID=A0A6A6EHM9_9PEZI|nr:hypothetical protein K469DRAFT_747402 [Zopfia rhizophila CBS 207.26]
MAKGVDGLIEFLLEETALCGSQGASGADFRRFVHKFYHQPEKSFLATFDDPKLSPGLANLDRKFLEGVWQWLVDHPDIRIVYDQEPRNLSLSEFEALELQEAGLNGATFPHEQQPHVPDGSSQEHTNKQTGVSVYNPLVSQLLRQALEEEGHAVDKTFLNPPNKAQNPTSNSNIPDNIQVRLSGENSVCQHTLINAERPANLEPMISEETSTFQEAKRDTKDPGYVGPRVVGSKRGPRKQRRGIIVTTPVFDEPSCAATVPRIYASQDRTWQAVAGHSIDLKALPYMEFILLSIIASRGSDGILQPELVRLSGQDKRSVPKRTDVLAQKRYIEKRAVNAAGMRTSICVHTKFVKEGHFLREGNAITNVKDVFVNSVFIPSNFVGLLFNMLKDTHIVAMKDLRNKLDMTLKKWNGRAIQSAILRLEETEFIRRVRARRKGSKTVWLICIKLLRPPNDEDIKNLNFKRRRDLAAPVENILEEDEGGDDIMRDLELEVDFDDDDTSGSNNHEEENDMGEVTRTPPQWFPNRLLSNLIFDAVEMGGMSGYNSLILRDMTMGQFWKRPVEAFVCRITDNWEQSQPQHLRHLAIIRDTTVTQEKKFVHYIYRTHRNFQRVVDVGEASWEAVSKEALNRASGKKPKGRPKQRSSEPKDALKLDQWGFPKLQISDFHHRDGKSSLTDCRRAIPLGKRKEESWDRALFLQMGEYKPRSRATPTDSVSRQAMLQRREISRVSNEMKRIHEHAVETVMREAGLGPTSQSGLNRAESDVYNDYGSISPYKHKGRPSSKCPQAIPLLTVEQRIALGLPKKGRLGQHIEDQIRSHRKKAKDPTALPELIVRSKPKPSPSRRKPGVSPLLTREERIARGLPPKGRLKKDVVDQIRTERGLTVSSATPGSGTSTEDDDTAMDDTDLTFTEGFASPGAFDQGQQDSEGASETRPDSLIFRSPPSIESANEPKPSTSVSGKHKPDPTSNNEVPNMKKARGDAETSPLTFRERLTRKTAASSLVDAESSVVASVETQYQSPYAPVNDGQNIIPCQDAEYTPVTPVQTNPQVPTDLKSRIQEIVKKYTDKPGPGIYINPFATRPIPRGRPRKALMAVFKSKRLKEFTWFQHDPTFISRYSLPTGPKRTYKKRKSVQGPDVVNEPPVSCTSDVDPEEETLLIDGARANEVSESSDIERPSLVVKLKLPKPKAATPRVDPLILHSTHPLWNAVNTPPITRLTRYQSPYASVPGNQYAALSTPVARSSLPRTEAETENGCDNASGAETPAAGVPNANEDERNLSVIRELSTVKTGPQKKHGTFTKRGVVLGRGSLHHLRNQILMEIVERCNGLFPGNGEIYPPFFKLWKERVGKTVSLPDKGTVSKAIKDLCDGQPRRLKRMSYRFCTSYGASIDKQILALPHIAPTSPEVRELQKNMSDRHPKRFFPTEICELVGEEPTWGGKAELPPKDMTIEVERLFPSESKLEARILASRKARKDTAETTRGQIIGEQKALNTPTERSTTKQFNRGRRKPGRLDTLNDGTKAPQNKTPYPYTIPTFNIDDLEESDGTERRSPAPSTSSEESISSPRLTSRSTHEDHSSKEASNIHPSSSDSETERENDTSSPDRPPAPQLLASVRTLPKSRPVLPDLDQREPDAGCGPKPKPGIDSTSSSADSYTEADGSGFVNQRPSHFDPHYEYQKVTTLLNPEVRFYPTIGTFSTEYSVKRNACINTLSVGLTKPPPKSLSEIIAEDLGKAPKKTSKFPQAPEHQFDHDVKNIVTWEEQYIDGSIDLGLPEKEKGQDPFINLEFPGKHISIVGTRADSARGRWILYHEGVGKQFTVYYDQLDFVPRVEPALVGGRGGRRAKRGRIRGNEDAGPQKKRRRLRLLTPKPAENDQGGLLDSDNLSTSEEDEVGHHSKSHVRVTKKEALSRQLTLVERLTGRAGDPDQPEPVRRIRRRKRDVIWKPQKHEDGKKKKKKKNPTERVGPTDTFKKLFITLVVAACMSGQEGEVNWNIVTSVFQGDSNFDVSKAKKLCSFMQTRMTSQFQTLTTDFQSRFFEAYEKGEIAPIESIEDYDWARLVTWALTRCKYIEAPLPADRSSLHGFVVEESTYSPFDHRDWARMDIPGYIKGKRALCCSYALPLHEPSQRKSTQHEDDLVKARSWIRSNTATPQSIYNREIASDKLITLGEPILLEALGDLLNRKLLKQWKRNFDRAGRNFDFVTQSAQEFNRNLELQDWMDAVRFKKDLDKAFSCDDPYHHSLQVVPMATTGLVMALSTLVSQGRVKIVPRLPQVNNDLKAPYPKLTVWGFMDGDYSTRHMDRRRLLWPIDAVPTSTYQFGNPLLPTSAPSIPPDSSQETQAWQALPDPPLPDANNPNALLPVWCSINGKVIIWAWWERILNVVLQAIVWQSGITCSEIYRQSKGIIELFEVELVLSWLESVNAISKTHRTNELVKEATFQANEGFWGAFGDHLQGKDWFGEHVSKTPLPDGQGWRHKYNMRKMVAKTAEANDGDEQGRDECATAGVTGEADGAANESTQEEGFPVNVTQKLKQQSRTFFGRIRRNGRYLAPDATMAARSRLFSNVNPTEPPGTDTEGMEMDWEPTGNIAVQPANASFPDPLQNSTPGDECINGEADDDADLDAEGEVDDMI